MRGSDGLTPGVIDRLLNVAKMVTALATDEFHHFSHGFQQHFAYDLAVDSNRQLSGKFDINSTSLVAGYSSAYNLGGLQVRCSYFAGEDKRPGNRIPSLARQASVGGWQASLTPAPSSPSPLLLFAPFSKTHFLPQKSSLLRALILIRPAMQAFRETQVRKSR